MPGKELELLQGAKLEGHQRARKWLTMSLTGSKARSKVGGQPRSKQVAKNELNKVPA